MVTSEVSIKSGTMKTNGEKTLIVRTPYHPTFPVRARKLGGRWNADQKYWLFDPRDVEAVKSLVHELFGIDPLASEKPELITVRFTLSSSPEEKSEDGTYKHRNVISGDGSAVWLFGREIVSRPGRDAGVRLGNGVVIISGSFAPSGGSTKHPELFSYQDERDKRDVVLEVRDVPKALYDALTDITKSTITVVETLDPNVVTQQIAAANAEQHQIASAEHVARLIKDVLALTPEQRQQVIDAITHAE